jgi:hypothetical protein
MSGRPAHVHPAGIELDEEQDIEPAQQHGVHSEEVARQHRGRLGFQELTPRRASSLRGGIEAVALEDVPDARRCKVDPQDRKLPVDPAIAPRWIFPGQANHNLHGPCGDPWTTRWLRVAPLATNQLSMPTEQRVGLDEEPRELRWGDQPAEAGKERSIRRSQGGAGHLPSKDRHLVTEHDDFDGQSGVVGPLQAEDLQGPEEGEVEEREGHEAFSRSRPLWRKSQIKVSG